LVSPLKPISGRNASILTHPDLPMINPKTCLQALLTKAFGHYRTDSELNTQPGDLSMSNVVIEWNNVYLEAIRQKGGAPCPIARVGAMMHGAIYDAVNSIVKTHRPYLISIPVEIGASIEAAVAQAAYQILIQVYPEQKATFDLRL
jgi:hypothetical protein